MERRIRKVGACLVCAFAGSVRGVDPHGEGATTLSLGSGDATGPSVGWVAEEDRSDSGGVSLLSGGVNYAVYSDYVFRGINLSEYRGEGREKPNHQIDAWFELDAGLLLGGDAESFGYLTFGSWFEWYADQEKLDPDSGGQNLQEIDYYVSWALDVESISSTFTLGANFYTLPNLKSYNTYEWFFQVEHNDAWMWTWLWPDNEDGILNPSVLYAQDLELTPGSIWIELAFSHEFDVSEFVTLTPKYTLGIDHRYLDPVLETGHAGSTRLALMQYGLNIDYDLSGAMGWSEDGGTWTISSFLYFSDALGNAKDKGLIKDELYGGVAIDWSF